MKTDEVLIKMKKIPQSFEDKIAKLRNSTFSKEIKCLNNECTLNIGNKCSYKYVIEGKFTCNERKITD